MADEKPKHKPQQKRTLEEVLKSLQDLIRSDLVSTKPLRQSWRESGHETADPNAAAAESDTFHKALFKLDQIISEKIIEPVERARQAPREPLLPDEEIEIEWAMDESRGGADGQRGGTEAADLAALDRVSASLEEIEIQPLEADAAAPTEAPTQPEPDVPAESPDQSLSIDPAIEPIELQPIEETLEATPVAPPEETVDLAPAPESAEPTEPTVRQQTFNFTATAQARTTAPPAKVSPQSALPMPERSDDGSTANAAPMEVVEDSQPRRPDDIMNVDLSDDAPSTVESYKLSEQPEVIAVESSSAATSDSYTVEFTVEPIAPPASRPTEPEAKTEAPLAKTETRAVADDIRKPPERSDVKEHSPPPKPPGTSEKPAERQPGIPGTASMPGQIPVLNEVADLSAPAAPPLPKASQARDIAIRVIAKLNIERRKTGEKPLDIKTIERLQQYLADALSKRALNKPK